MVIAAARLANAVFFLMTATYCLLTYSSFAYQNFIRPHLINWLSDFVAFHHVGFWVTLGITALTIDAVNSGYQVVIPREAVTGTPDEYVAAVMENTLRLLATITTVEQVEATWRG